jgi:hypothetical protein
LEHKTNLLIKESSLPEDVNQQLWPHGLVPPRLYGLPKICKEEDPEVQPCRTFSRPNEIMSG